ncbi:MAG: PIN domain-containing protein [Gaiellales bacterium]
MLVVDSGPLVAAALSRDRNHTRCVELLMSAERPLIVPTLVVTEVAYFLGERLGQHAERSFVGALRDGELEVEPIAPGDWDRIYELLDEYDGLGLGVVDASILALMERLDLAVLATLDHRHFGVLRPAHRDALILLPN